MENRLKKFQTPPEGKHAKIVRTDHVVYEYPLGQLEIVCRCGWSGMNFYDLTSTHCPRCSQRFSKRRD